MEAKWFNEGYIPRMEEYMEVATISASYHLFASVSFLALGDVASKEVFEWAQTDPMLLKATGVIGRLLNDIVSHKYFSEVLLTCKYFSRFHLSLKSNYFIFSLNKREVTWLQQLN